jgi:cytoskeletal protein RodZ
MTMSSTKDSLSYGQYLQSSRLEKQISLESVSEETRIGLDILRLIENEDHENLPAEVFVKGFLCAYARAIGVDGAEAVRRYETRINVVQTLNGAEKESVTKQTGRWWRFLLATVMYFALILITVYGHSFFEKHSSQKPTHDKLSVDQEATGEDAQSQDEMDTAEAAKENESSKHLLLIAAQEDTWIKIIIDNGESKKYELSGGEDLKLEAFSKFNLMIGNAAAIRVKFNDQTIPILGKSGEIVNIDLP